MSIAIPNGEAMSHNSKNKTALIEGWGEFLSQFDWDWFVTLTYRRSVGLRGAKNRLIQLIRYIRKDIGHRIEFFCIPGWQKRGVAHYHGFFGGLRGISGNKYQVWWKRWYGSAEIEEYDKNLGGRFYLAKHAIDPDVDFLMSRSLKKILIPERVAESLKAISQSQHP